MAFQWKKLGRVFAPEAQYSWMQSHAALPFAQVLTGDIVRVYFSCRDAEQRAHVAHVEFDLRKPNQILAVASSPVLVPGRLGAFDDSGSILCWITEAEQSQYLYYVGWNQSVTVPFRNALGLAVKSPAGRFEKYSQGPVLDRSPIDPFFVASACVLREGSAWRMWYLSCVRWEVVDGKPMHWYHIKHATSVDGINWRPDAKVCIDFKSPAEYAISRPCVVKDGSRYRMWYSCRGQTYRIGYAESVNGLDWDRRDDEVGIDVSPTGWDSEMIEYPHVFDHRASRYMVYNGNGYGKTGFGLAVAA